MAQVPYQPFSTAQPSGGGEKIAVNTPGAAFGENIGAALQHLGTTTEQVGGELFQRAMALQDLKNENDARDADANYAQQQSLLHADYSAKTGKDAADGLKPYIQQSNQLRQQFRDNLNNPMAQRMYDASSLSFMQRNIFNAAGHAATENKKYTIDTLKSSTDIDVNAVGDNPDDDKLFADKLSKIKHDTTNAAMLQSGAESEDEPIVQDAVQQATSSAVTARVLGKAKTDPFSAMKWLENYKDQMTRQDYQRAESVVEAKGSAVGGVNIATNIFAAHRQPDGTYDVTTAQMQDEARKKAADLMPDNKLLPTVAVQKLDGMINQDRYSKRQDNFDAMSAVKDAIGKGNVTDVQQLFAMPGMDKVIEKLPPDQRNGLQGYINRFNAAAHKITNEDAKLKINGLMNNDVESFLNTDLTDPKLGLSKADIITYQNKQTALAKNPQDDPRVMRALSMLRGSMGPQLQSLGVYSRDHNNPDDYDHFTGALSEAIQEWQVDHKHPPSGKDIIDTIGPQIINTQAQHKGWLWNSQEPAFHQFNRPTPQEVPPEFKEKVTNDVLQKGGSAPTDQQILQAFTRTQFIKLYGGAAKSTNPSAEGPQSK